MAPNYSFERTADKLKCQNLLVGVRPLNSVVRLFRVARSREPRLVVCAVVASGRGVATAAKGRKGGGRSFRLRSSIKGSPRVEREAAFSVVWGRANIKRLGLAQG
jgi:hypothetical protein